MNIFVKHSDGRDRKKEIVDFFIKNKTDNYISHSEILSGRSESPDKWSENIEKIFFKELDDKSIRVITMEDESNKIIGLAILCVSGKYLIIEDMLIDQNLRGFSLGNRLMKEILDFAYKNNAKSLFLESGILNEKAHSFFEKHGFGKISVNYMLKLR